MEESTTAAHGQLASTWEELLSALRRDCARSVERTVERMAAMPSYGGIEASALWVVVHRNHEAMLAGLQLRRPPTPADVSAVFGQHGEVRARQGVALSDMLAAWRAGQESFYLLASTLTEPGPGADGLLREFLELLMRWVDIAMLAAAEGHRRADANRIREREHVTANLLRRAMTGQAAAAEIAMGLASFGLEPDQPYYAVRARPGPLAGIEEIERFLLGSTVAARRRRGLTALVDDDVCGLVRQLPDTPSPVAVGVSSPSSLRELEVAFRHAGRALETAVALGIHGTFDLATLGAQAAVVSDTDIGDAMVRRYLDPVEAAAGGAHVLGTVRCWLDNNAHVDITARALGVHANTVRHRIARFEELTHVSLRDTETLVEVWWALQRRRVSDGQ